MLGFESDVYWKNEFFLVFCKYYSLLLLQQFYSALVDEIGQKFGMISSENSWHEEFDIEANHIFPCMTKEITNISSNFLDFSSFLHQIDINNTIVSSNTLPFSFEQHSFLESYLPCSFFELVLSTSIGLQISVENKDGKKN